MLLNSDISVKPCLLNTYLESSCKAHTPELMRKSFKNREFAANHRGKTDSIFLLLYGASACFPGRGFY